MKVGSGLLLAMVLFAATAPAAMAADAPVFGPARYEVTERYGKHNTYTIEFAASESPYLISVQNGDDSSKRSDFIELTVNGQVLLLDGRYAFPVIACFAQLKKMNTMVLELKDARPAGYRRPPAVPKSVTITVLPVPRGMAALRGSFGLLSMKGMTDIVDVLRTIRNPAAAKLAMDAGSFHLTVEKRAEAIRKLSSMKEPTAETYLLRVYRSGAVPGLVRAEAALAIAVLGNTSRIPLLLQGIVDPDAQIRAACAQALALFPEDQTGDALIELLTQLDSLRRKSTLDSIAASGWRPFASLRRMADHKDPVVAAVALELIGKFREPRSTDLLLELLAKKDAVDLKAVVQALGATGDPRATEALLSLASDPEQRAGMEVYLAESLADLGDQRAAPLIGEMIRKAKLFPVESRLRNAYRRLTGKNY